MCVVLCWESKRERNLKRERERERERKKERVASPIILLIVKLSTS